MNKSIAPIRVQRTRSGFGFSLVLELMSKSNKVEKRVDLSPVLDLSYTQRGELEELLEGFIATLPKRLLNSKEIIKLRLKLQEQRRSTLLLDLLKVEESMEKLKEELGQ